MVLVIMTLTGFGAEWARRRRQKMDALSARNFLYERTKGLLEQKMILKMAAMQLDLGPGNAALNHCLATPPVDCTAWGPDSQVAFGLRSGADPSSPMIVGTNTQPAIYSSIGSQTCNDQGPECAAWSIEAWFWAECPRMPLATKDELCQSEPKIFIRHRVRGLNDYRYEASQPDAEYFESTPVASAFQWKEPREGTK